MVNVLENLLTGLDEREFRFGPLVRIAGWGLGAAAALFLAVLAGLSDRGAHRAIAAVSSLAGGDKAISAPIPAQASIQHPPETAETRRLAQQVRLLAEDRGRVLQRLNELEHNLDDITGSIRKQQPANPQQPASSGPAGPPSQVKAPAPSAAPAATGSTTPWSSRQASQALPAWPAAAAVPIAPASHLGDAPASNTASSSATAAVAGNSAASVNARQPDQNDSVAPDQVAALEPPATPLPPPRPTTLGTAEASEATAEAEPPVGTAPPPDQASLVKAAPRTTYGVDLGGDISMTRLRMLWRAMRESQNELLHGLRPIARTNRQADGQHELRLIVGPLASVDDASRICTAIINQGHFCQPAIYSGHRLSAR